MKKQDITNRKKEIVSWLITILISISIAIGIQVFFQINRVSGNSMQPNLQNEDIFISLRSNWTEIKRGDIVDVDAKSLRYVGSDMLVKRIIGMPGEKVTFKDGEIFINNNKIKESYKVIDKESERNENLDTEIKLKKNEYFILGDNRNNSTDSRILGAIHKDVITSKYLFTLPDIISFPFKLKP